MTAKPSPSVSHKSSNPLTGFSLDPAALGRVGHGLQRPECILAEPDGTLWAADARGGVTRIAPDGSQYFIGQKADSRFALAAIDTADGFEAKFTQGTLPNGLAFAANGDILISNFGTDRLEVMTRDGQTRTLFDQIDGLPIGVIQKTASGSRFPPASTLGPKPPAAG